VNASARESLVDFVTLAGLLNWAVLVQYFLQTG